MRGEDGVRANRVQFAYTPITTARGGVWFIAQVESPYENRLELLLRLCHGA